MKTSAAIALVAAQLVAGHATFQSFVIGGKDQGQHFAVQTPSNSNNPIKDVTSPLMVCNGGKATSDFVEVAAGSEITMQWHHNDPAIVSGDADEPIAASHKGPIMVYMAPAKGNGEGAVWTKIYEDGLTNGKWAVDTFIANKGRITVKLPNLADGNYLIRPETISLHEGNNAGGAQFYNGCGQIKVTGGSVALPSTGVDMTKAYSATDKGVLFNMYNGATTYKIPGPAVWDGASSGTTPATPTKPAASSAPPVSSAKPTKPAASSAPPVSSAKPTKPAASSAAPVSSAAPSKTAKPVSSATPVATPIKEADPSTPSPTTTPSTGSGSGSTLPKTFTITQFIDWLKQQTGSAAKARRHARAFNL